MFQAALEAKYRLYLTPSVTGFYTITTNYNILVRSWVALLEYGFCLVRGVAGRGEDRRGRLWLWWV